MNWAAIVYLGVTIGLFVLFAVIVARTYSRNRKSSLEEPKHRMLDDE